MGTVVGYLTIVSPRKSVHVETIRSTCNCFIIELIRFKTVTFYLASSFSFLSLFLSFCYALHASVPLANLKWEYPIKRIEFREQIKIIHAATTNIWDERTSRRCISYCIISKAGLSLFFLKKYTGFIICDLKTKNGGERKMRGKDTEWEFTPCSVVGKKIYIIRWNICHEIEIKCTRTF